MRLWFAAPIAVLFLSETASSQSTPPAAPVPKFILIDADALLSSRLVGSNVRNRAGENVGKIEDIALQGGQLTGVVLSVSGGTVEKSRYVAVDPSSISIRYTEGEDAWAATLNATLDDLKSAPEFRYEGKWKR